MITELFSMLSSIDVSRGNGSSRKPTITGALSVNMNRNRIRSISAYSSNSIFYFQVATTDQATPEETAMVSRTLEKSYASFVAACISLMPFHRIRADDKASIEDYLSQFHQNLGISPGGAGAMGKVFGLMDTLAESTYSPDDLAATQKFLLECWERSRKSSTDFIKVVNESVSLNDMYNTPAVDPVTKVLQEQYFAKMEELETWGFIGEATATMFDTDDDDTDVSDEELLGQIIGDDDDPDEKDDEDEDDDDWDDEDLELGDLDEAVDLAALGRKLGKSRTLMQVGRHVANTSSFQTGVAARRRSIVNRVRKISADEKDLRTIWDDIPASAKKKNSLKLPEMYDFKQYIIPGNDSLLRHGVPNLSAKELKEYHQSIKTAKRELRKYSVKNESANLLLHDDVVAILYECAMSGYETPLNEETWEPPFEAEYGGFYEQPSSYGGSSYGGSPPEIGIGIPAKVVEIAQNVIVFGTGMSAGIALGLLIVFIRDHWDIKSIKKEIRRIKDENNILMTANTRIAETASPIGFVIGAGAGFATSYGLKRRKDEKIIRDLQDELISLEYQNSELRRKWLESHKELPAGVPAEPVLFNQKFTDKRFKKDLLKRLKLKIKSKFHKEPKNEAAAISEGTVKTAVNSIMFSLEAVSENKIMSCQSLSKLSSLEAKLNKLKNKYAKYLNRYKRKYKENKENGTNKKLSIRFNGMEISNPKAFMQQYGSYIKVINKRLKMIEKRRAELRKRKGIKGSEKIEESAINTLTDLDLQTVDYCINAIDEAISAPDSKVFILTEARKPTYEELQDALYEKNRDSTNPLDPSIGINAANFTAYYDRATPKSNINAARHAKKNGEKIETFGKEVFTNMDLKKANEAIPTFTKASIGFIVDETDEVVTRDVLIGIKAYIHKVPAADMITDIYNCIINKRKLLKFVKFITGEERSLADLMFGIKELRSDALQSRDGSMGQWAAAFRRRKRLSKMSVPYLMKEYTPNGTIVITMNEVQFIRDEYGIDIMTPDHINMIMDHSFLLGFVVLDQANEICYITYDGHGGNFQQYTYAMLERESNQSDRAMRELYRAMAR